MRSNRTSRLRGAEITPHCLLLNALGVIGVPVPSSWCYALVTSEGLVLIDPGLRESWGRAETNRARLAPARPLLATLLTHGHGDHAFAVAEPALRHLPTYAGGWVGEWLGEDPLRLYREDLSYTERMAEGFPPLRGLAGGERLRFAELEIEALATPGHTPGCMSYLFELDGRRIAAIGDLIFPDGRIGHAGSPLFSAEAAIHSLESLAAAAPDLILGGHFIEGEGIPAFLDHVRRRAEAEHLTTEGSPQ